MKYFYSMGCIVLLTGFFGAIWPSVTQEDCKKYEKDANKAVLELKKTVLSGFSKSDAYYLTDAELKPVSYGGSFQQLSLKSAKRGSWFMWQKSWAVGSHTAYELATDLLNFLTFTAAIFHKIEANNFTKPVFVFKAVPSEEWFSYMKSVADLDNKNLTWRDYNLTGKDTTDYKISVNLRENGAQPHRYYWLGNSNFRSIAFSLDTKTNTWSVWPHDSDKSVPALPKNAQIINLDAGEFEIANAILSSEDSEFSVCSCKFTPGKICALAIEKYFAAIDDDESIDQKFIDFLKLAKKTVNDSQERWGSSKSGPIFDYLIKKLG